MPTFSEVILPLPLNESFTYAIPEQLSGKVQAGCRVLVQFGAQKTYTALVVKVHNKRPLGKFQIKPLLSLLDETPIITQQQLEFWRWISKYYMCSLGEVLKAALPSKLRQPKSRANIVNESKDLVCESDEPKLKELNTYQQKAYEDIIHSFTSLDVTLLNGVTSSGKTEIYIHLINKYIRAHKQVLYLLPEIALTTQITQRLKKVFGDDLGVFHSKFTDKERSRVYFQQISDQPYKVILGVRSSIFLPFKDLGLVIVDEEHETSYKQQDPAPRYHARSSAIMLAKLCGAKTLLGTATPSIESYRLAQNGKYGFVSLNHRFKDLQLPDIDIIDVRELYKRKQMKGVFSPMLIECINHALADQEQVILFQNRRGFSDFIQCKNCGWVPHCDRCDVSLTYHKKQNELSCHYCGKHFLLPVSCPNCECRDFSFIGLGTEKIESELHKLFPDVRIARMDLDTTRTRSDYEEIINDFSLRKYDILVGTQMVSKGLDFDNVSVVGILDADSMLNLPDFRSYERAYHLMTQVAGRAGRKYHTGKVIIQSRSLDTSILSYVKNGDYEAMYKDQSTERQLFIYPPFSRLIYIYFKHRDFVRVEQCASFMAQELRRIFGDRILGPDSPPIARVHSLIVRKIIIKLHVNDSPTKVRETLNQIKDTLFLQPFANGLTLYYDVDPV
ncbi:MAG: primosomal protein N' [Bacteroidaceae bacterium]|nr:primosomal protein N' [Bacteroidaceae bacterium]